MLHNLDPVHSDSAPEPNGAGTGMVRYVPLWDDNLQRAVDGEGQTVSAVLVCHGMGEQVRYQTISSVAEAILEAARSRVGKENVSPPNVALAGEAHNYLPRAELRWRHTNEAGPQHEHHVHVYEAYWAPITGGRVTYWDTIKFVFSAAWSGITHSRPWGSQFCRWMFGGPKRCTITSETFYGLVLGTLAFLVQILVIGLVSIVFIGGLRFAVFGLPQFKQLNFGLIDIVDWFSRQVPGLQGLIFPLKQHDMMWGAVELSLWLLFVAEALVVRYFLIQYVGDVAAYISPYKASKFDEIRQRIQKVGTDVAKVIYGFGSSGSASTGAGIGGHDGQNVPKYERIIIAGHSLGSVLAYDTLNAMINLDQVSAKHEQRDVVRRTCALITFGSPLDKTAFLFRVQARKAENWIREQLAASVQPLIVDYKYRCDSLEHPTRKLNWVNIWSPADKISGSLDYYDDPDLLPTDPRFELKVENRKDAEVKNWFTAHVQYWHKPELREQLYRFLGMEAGATENQPEGRARRAAGAGT
jgi:hypothetical protein